MYVSPEVAIIMNIELEQHSKDIRKVYPVLENQSESSERQEDKKRLRSSLPVIKTGSNPHISR